MSSAGLNINIVNFTLKFNFAYDDIGIYGLVQNNSNTATHGIRVNLSELKIGYSGTTSVQLDSVIESVYTNVDIDVPSVIAIVIFITTGQPVMKKVPTF